MGDSRERLREFPDEVRDEVGFALYLAQTGDAHQSAKPMKGCGAVEIVSDFDGNAFRAIYTAKFKENIYVLHCFQKKSNRGGETPKRDRELIEKRLKDAEIHFKARSRSQNA
jgi:phage-related protein